MEVRVFSTAPLLKIIINISQNIYIPNIIFILYIMLKIVSVLFIHNIGVIMSDDLNKMALEYHRNPTAGKISVQPTKRLAIK